jgi:ABC-type glycerol-3-phosphate transport system substrate-binding protein
LQAGTPITETTAQGVRASLQNEEVFGSTPAESAVNFYTQFADPAKSVYSWNRSLPNSRQGFISGDVAMYVGFASEFPYLISANPNIDIDMASIPQPATASTRTTYGVGYVFALPKQAPNPTGAFTVATALTEASAMDTAAQSYAMAPARSLLLSVTSENKYTPIYYSAALTARGWLSPSPATTDGIFAGMIGNIISGRLDVEQAINAAEQSFNASLR